MSINDENGLDSLRKQALEQVNATRARLEADHPELMKTVRRRLMEQEMGLESQPAPAINTSIDRKKNMMSVLKFLETCPNPGLFRDAVKSFLAESRA